MNEKNIETIKEQLISLGLPPTIEAELRVNMCLHQEQFHVNFRQAREQDVLYSIFYFEKKEGEYCCSYYEMCLRKKIAIPEILVNEIDVNDLGERMSKIDWQILLLNTSESHQRSENRSGWKREEEIENIVADLKRLSGSPGGVQIADRLKVKFWMNTPLMSLIPNVGALKNQYEISQRFYFFEGEEQISLDEAYRFLSHRWREKQLNLKKKQEEVDVADANEAGNEGQQKDKRRGERAPAKRRKTKKTT